MNNSEARRKLGWGLIDDESSKFELQALQDMRTRTIDHTKKPIQWIVRQLANGQIVMTKKF